MNEKINAFMKLYGAAVSDREYNLFEAAQLREFRHSEILFHLLSFTLQGRHVFLERFLDRLSIDTTGWSFTQGDVFVSREEHLAGRPIDVLVRCPHHALIVENKCCNACDMDRQLRDYIENVKNEYKITDENLACLYLRRIDSLEKPSESSTGDGRHADMVTVSSYRELVLPWLRDDVLPNVPRASGVMVASLIAYIDVLESWSGERSRMLKDGQRAVAAFQQSFGCGQSDTYKLCSSELDRANNLSDEAVAALGLVKRTLWENDPTLNAYDLAEELKWMLKNNAYPYGRTAMRSQLDLGRLFDYSSVGRWYNVVKIERNVISPTGQEMRVRLHFNCQNVAADRLQESWLVYGGVCETLESIPALDKIMDALSTIGFRAVNDSGFFFAESEALGKQFRASASGRDKLWAIASKLAECCKVCSGALVGAGYSALVK